jgi:hypothetical protein
MTRIKDWICVLLIDHAMGYNSSTVCSYQLYFTAPAPNMHVQIVKIVFKSYQLTPNTISKTIVSEAGLLYAGPDCE